jgi:superfamily I DNA and/or RNA helicase
MSPLSVAQYLDPRMPPFDLVVFDEASQIPTWDAVGALARGTQAIVVGDSKQLPPTNFFQRENNDDSPDESDSEELESILDECVASGIPELSLKWHYRSRHESLIAFSNRHYYADRLFTFPSADSRRKDRGVSFRHVMGGVYDRGRKRTNEAEARAIVAEVVKRVKSGDKRSIGIVTFSQPQQELVENLLDEERQRLPQLDELFASSRDEPIFVKNLENVQGDERDVILFSVCYGPDKDGEIWMSFGALNNAGGERRLNVAITRAREQVIVFASIKPDQINLGRSRAVGVAHLRAFLEYAERGAKVLNEIVTPTEAAGSPTIRTPFEDSIRRAIQERGWKVESRVGYSGYRIDLAVKDRKRAANPISAPVS